jgi:hypothetical protein
MKRRDFIKGTAVAAAVPFLPVVRTNAEEVVLKFDPPLEVPTPPLGTGVLLTPQMIAREIIYLTREKYLKHPCVSVSDGGPKLGDLWAVPGHKPAILAHQINSEWPFSVVDLTLDLDEYSARWLDPVSCVLAKRMDETMQDRGSSVIATAPLPLPQGVKIAARANWRGLHVRVVGSYFIEQDREIMRVDVLYGGTVPA